MKKIIVMILIFIMLSTTFHKDYLKAFGIGEGVLATVVATNPEVAILVGLGCLGVVCVASVYDKQDELCNMANKIKNDFIDFCSKSEEWASVTSAKIEYWLEGVSTGIIDKADDVYGALKDFLAEEYKAQQTSSPSDVVPIEISNVAQYVLANKQYLLDNVKYINVPFSDVEDVAMSQHTISTVDARWSGMHEDPETHENVNNTMSISDNTSLAFIYFNDTASTKPYILEISTNTIDDDFTTDNYYYYPFSYMHGNGKGYGSGAYNPIDINSTRQYFNFLNSIGHFRSVGAVEVDLSFLTNAKNHRVYTFDTTHVELNSITGNSWKTRCILSYIVSCIYHDIALPGLTVDDGLSEEETQSYIYDKSVSDIIERDGTLDNVDVVNPSDVESDSIPVDLTRVTVQDISEPFPYPDVKTVDKSTDTVLPDNTPATDLPNDRPVSEFTISNLQTVFPFCVPFDLFKLYNTLKCDAVAPSFTWKFPYYKNNEIVYNEIEIDLKQFDTVAEISRIMELLAFLVFLTLKTRDLIRG